MRTSFLFLVCSFCLSLVASASAASSGENQITPPELEQKIARGLMIVSDSKPFSPEDATMLVRLSNTLFLIDRPVTKKEADLQGRMWGGDFTERLKTALGDPTINKGMGYYFPKPDLHWGGSGGNIRARDRYEIVSKKENSFRSEVRPRADPNTSGLDC